MWVCTNFGFFSIVKNKYEDDSVVVRARKESHLIELMKKVGLVGQYDINQDKKNDYEFRIFVSTDISADILSCLAHNIEYSNFKDSVENPQLSEFYHRVWYDGFKILADNKGTLWG